MRARLVEGTFVKEALKTAVASALQELVSPVS
jgi:hypothetical protein